MTMFTNTKHAKLWSEMTEKERNAADRARTCAALGITAEQYLQLARIGRLLNKLYTASCNGEIDDKKCDTEEHALHARVLKVLPTRIYVYLQTDPRGAALYLSKDKMTDMNYTTGHCIV